jgi:hypothetical protein
LTKICIFSSDSVEEAWEESEETLVMLLERMLAVVLSAVQKCSLVLDASLYRP